MRKFNATVILQVCFLVCFTGCASVKFYKGPGDETDKEVGFPFYPPKPYILIEKGEKGLVTSVISLPDTSKPYYVKTSTGLGTAQMGFDIKDAMISKFNSSTDSKIPETITALSTLATGSAALITAESMKLTAEKLKDESEKTLSAMLPQKSKSTVDYTLDEYVKASFELECKVKPLMTGLAPNVKCKDTVTKEKEENVKALLEKLFGQEKLIVEDQIQILDQNNRIQYELEKPDILIEKLKKSVTTTESVISELTYLSDRLITYIENPGDFPQESKYAPKIHKPIKESLSILSKLLADGRSKEGLYEIHYLKSSLVLRKIDPFKKIPVHN